MNFKFLLHPFVSASMALEKSIAPAPLETKIATDMRIAQKRVMEYDHTIRLQQFGKHMALAEIQALTAWAEMERAQQNPLGELFP